MRNVYREIRGRILQHLIPRSGVSFDSGNAVEVAGLLSMTAGIGESARLCADALVRSGHELRLADVSFHTGESKSVEWLAPRQTERKATTRILHLNPPMIPRGIGKLGLNAFLKAYNIGYWAWELEIIPDEWKNAIRYMNALFVPSQFTRAALLPYAKIPIFVVPHPVAEKHATVGIRSQFGIPDGVFLLSSIFSAGSSINRKNPEAVLRAFQILREKHSDAFLLMKASGDPGRDEGLRRLLKMADEIGNVRIVADNLPSSVITGIIAQSDAYISLHRSEGFGLTVAEAILAGTPVVSTGWSGTVDFCDVSNTWNTDYRLVPVIDTHPEFANLRGARWADADPMHAAQQLAEICFNRELAKERAQNARHYLRNYLASHTYAGALEELARTETA